MSDALDGVDVLIACTSVTAAKENALAAIDAGVAVVIGTSLTIRHDAGGTPEPYVAGTLIAARRAPELVGLTRGLHTLPLTG